jgi:hypothetical protein
MYHMAALIPCLLTIAGDNLIVGMRALLFRLLQAIVYLDRSHSSTNQTVFTLFFAAKEFGLNVSPWFCSH